MQADGNMDVDSQQVIQRPFKEEGYKPLKYSLTKRMARMKPTRTYTSRRTKKFDDASEVISEEDHSHDDSGIKSPM